MATLALVLAAVLLTLLPGMMVASALAPGWRAWERLAAAPGLGVGLIGVVGLVYHEVHVPFEAASVLPGIAVVTVAAALVWNRRQEKPLPSRGWTEWAIPAAALVAGAASVAVAVAGFHGQPLPIYSDGALHATVTRAITDHHDVIAPIPEPVAHTGFTRPRTALEASAAVLTAVTRADISDSMVVLALIAVLLLPLGLAALGLEATGSWRVAALAPLLALGMAMPKWPVLFGEYPLLLDATLVAPLLIAATRTLRGRRNAAFITAAVVAIFVTHGLEALTALVVGAGLLLGVALAVGRPAVTRLAMVGGAALAGAVLATVLVHLASAGAPVGDSTGSSEGVRSVTAPITVNARWVLDNYVSIELGGALVSLLLVTGMVIAFVRRQLRWAVLAGAFFFLALVDVQAVHRFTGLWEKLYPWAVEDRLRDMEYWAVPLLVALCVEEIWRAGRVLAGRLRVASGEVRSRRVELLAGGVVVLVVAAVVSAGVSRDRQTYADVVPAFGKATAADVAVMRQMATALRPGSLILTDGEDDAGIWINVLTPDLRLLPKPWVQAHPDDFRVVALQQACASPEAAAAALHGVDAVFVGSRHSVDATHPWKLDCIRHVAGLEPLLEASSGGHTAALFAVEPSAQASGQP